MIRVIFVTLLFFGINDALTCQKCGNAGECSSMEDNGAPKVCDDGEACMFETDYSDMKTGYIRDCRPLNESLPNCYNVTMHDVSYRIHFHFFLKLF